MHRQTIPFNYYPQNKVVADDLKLKIHKYFQAA